MHIGYYNIIKQYLSDLVGTFPGTRGSPSGAFLIFGFIGMSGKKPHHPRLGMRKNSEPLLLLHFISLRYIAEHVLPVVQHVSGTLLNKTPSKTSLTIVSDYSIIQTHRGLHAAAETIENRPHVANSNQPYHNGAS